MQVSLSSGKIKFNKRLFFFSGVAIVMAIFSIILSLQLTQWIYAINVRVRLYVKASAETKLNICWDKSQTECLPLVPYSTVNGRIAQGSEIADVWLSELPPRPSYFIALKLEKEIIDLEFQYLELDSEEIFLQGYGKENDVGVNKLRLNLDNFEERGIKLKFINGIYFLESETGGILIHTQEIKSGPQGVSRDGTPVMIWIILMFTFLLVLIAIYLLPRALSNLRSSSTSLKKPNYSWIWLLSYISIGVVMMLLVVKSGVILHQYDPMNYLSLATGEGWFNVSRLPGYPLFLGLALYLTGNNLDGVLALQSLILTFSVIMSIWILRKWVPPYIAFFFVLFSLFSPAQVFFARWILRESLFSSLMILGVTVSIAYFTSRKPLSYLWMMIFTLICGCAFMLRENGVILPFSLIPVFGLRFYKDLRMRNTIKKHIYSMFKLILQFSPPFVVVFVVYAAFSSYNYFHYGYFQMEEQQTSHGLLSKAMSPANFDARGLLDSRIKITEEADSYVGWPLYSAYILARDQNPNSDQTYIAFYPSINTQMLERDVPASQFNVFHQASILNEIGKSVDYLIPQRAVLSGALRQYISFVFPVLTNQYPLAGPSNKTSMVGFLSYLPVRVTINNGWDSIPPDSVIAKYLLITQNYPWYETLFIGALLAGLYILKYQDPVFLAPIIVFLANGALVLYSRMVAPRVFVNVDILLVLQITLGLSLWLSHRTFLKKTTIEIN